jgi:formylglycine-generating enzyme required for sulfatase activity
MPAGNKSGLNRPNHFLSGPLISEHKYVVVPGYEDHPVICINWYGAFLYALSKGCKLPTEAEWEVASKSCMDDFVYEWGLKPPTKKDANFGEHYGETTPIGSFPPNDIGLLDMTSNTREWCLDWYTPDKKYVKDRKIELSKKQCVSKVIKGCGWNRGQSSMQCYKRTGKWPRLGGANIGFRLVYKG